MSLTDVPRRYPRLARIAAWLGYESAWHLFSACEDEGCERCYDFWGPAEGEETA